MGEIELPPAVLALPERDREPFVRILTVVNELAQTVIRLQAKLADDHAECQAAFNTARRLLTEAIDAGAKQAAEYERQLDGRVTIAEEIRRRHDAVAALSARVAAQDEVVEAAQSWWDGWHNDIGALRIYEDRLMVALARLDAVDVSDQSAQQAFNLTGAEAATERAVRQGIVWPNPAGYP